jgi:hypothetical protein
MQAKGINEIAFIYQNINNVIFELKDNYDTYKNNAGAIIKLK